MFRLSFVYVSFPRMLFHWFALGLAASSNYFLSSVGATSIEYRQAETAECFKPDRMRCFSVGRPDNAFDKANEDRLNLLQNLGYSGGKHVIQIPTECPKEEVKPVPEPEKEEETPCEVDPLVASVTDSIRASAGAIVQEANEIYKHLCHAAEYIAWMAANEKCPQPIKVLTHIKPRKCPTAMHKCKYLKECEVPLDRRPNRSAFYVGAFSDEDLNNAINNIKPLDPKLEMLKMTKEEREAVNKEDINRLTAIIQYS